MEESIQQIKDRFVGKDQMLLFRVEGPMPDGLVVICRALGCFEDVE